MQKGILYQFLFRFAEILYGLVYVSFEIMDKWFFFLFPMLIFDYVKRREIFAAEKQKKHSVCDMFYIS